MRESIASIAVIRRECQHQTLWLAQWSRSWQGFHFVGGHKHPDESFRECVIREVCEELQITAGVDFLVAEQPRARLDYTAWSKHAGQETHYVMQLFDVTLTDSARQKVEADPQNRWVTTDEIRQQRCSDGQPISETMGLLLDMAGLSRECAMDVDNPVPEGRDQIID
jgi:8-oxo-dGTP pyrophosphatase MutT (NUDIX family)